MSEESKPDHELAREELSALVLRIGMSIASEPTTRECSDWDKRSGHYRCTMTAPHWRNRSKGADPDSLPKYAHVVTYSVVSGILVRWASEQKVGRPMQWSPRTFRPVPMSGRLNGDQASELAYVAKAYRPDIVDVLSSMVFDVSEYQPDMSFREWCDEQRSSFGDDWIGKRNPADLLDVFELVRATSKWLRTVFSESEMDSVRDLCARL